MWEPAKKENQNLSSFFSSLPHEELISLKDSLVNQTKICLLAVAVFLYEFAFRLAPKHTRWRKGSDSSTRIQGGWNNVS